MITKEEEDLAWANQKVNNAKADLATARKHLQWAAAAYIKANPTRQGVKDYVKKHPDLRSLLAPCKKKPKHDH